MKTTRKPLLLLALSSFLFAGCGKMNLSINKKDILPAILNPFSAPTSAEIVAGSVQDQQTSHFYRVTATAGTMLKEVQSTTTNGYKVSYGLDGELISQ